MNTPSISVSSSRKAIIYSLTRVSTFQLAAMTSGIIKVVSITNRIEIPSTPRRYCSPISHCASSTNWNPVLDGSKSNRMNSEIRKVTVVVINASHFALRPAAASSPRRNTARISAAKLGMKVMMESK